MTRRVVEVASVIRLGEESVIIRWPQDGRGLLLRGQLARVGGGGALGSQRVTRVCTYWRWVADQPLYIDSMYNMSTIQTTTRFTNIGLIVIEHN